jgi:hypothetical protein
MTSGATNIIGHRYLVDVTTACMWSHCDSFSHVGDRSSIVAKVLRYKSEGRWFDPALLDSPKASSNRIDDSICGGIPDANAETNNTQRLHRHFRCARWKEYQKAPRLHTMGNNLEETGPPGLPMSWSPTLFSRSGPVGLPPVLWTEKELKGK